MIPSHRPNVVHFDSKSAPGDVKDTQPLLCQAHVFQSVKPVQLVNKDRKAQVGMYAFAGRASEDAAVMFAFPPQTVELLSPETIMEGMQIAGKSMEEMDISPDPRKDHSGAIACWAIGRLDKNRNVEAYAFNLGDSCAQLIILDKDNNPIFNTRVNLHIHQVDEKHEASKDETLRLMEQGKIEIDPVYKDLRLQYLNMTRGHGDRALLEQGFSNVPEINSLKKIEEEKLKGKKIPPVPEGGRAIMVIHTDFIDHQVENFKSFGMDTIVGQELKKGSDLGTIAKRIVKEGRTYFSAPTDPIDDASVVVVDINSEQMVGGAVYDGHSQPRNAPKKDNFTCVNSLCLSLSRNFGKRLSDAVSPLLQKNSINVDVNKLGALRVQESESSFEIEEKVEETVLAPMCKPLVSPFLDHPYSFVPSTPEQDYKTAMRCLKRRSERFEHARGFGLLKAVSQKKRLELHLEATYQLGICYKDGKGCEKDVYEALKCFDYLLSKDILAGDLKSKTMDAKKEVFKNANTGMMQHEIAQWLLGKSEEAKDEGKQKDLELAAFQWCSAAAYNINADSFCDTAWADLGSHYEQGIGVEADLVKAALCYRKYLTETRETQIETKGEHAETKVDVEKSNREPALEDWKNLIPQLEQQAEGDAEDVDTENAKFELEQYKLYVEQQAESLQPRVTPHPAGLSPSNMLALGEAPIQLKDSDQHLTPTVLQPKYKQLFPLRYV